MANPDWTEPSDWETPDPCADALLTVVDAVRDYLPPDGIDVQECLNRIIGATDNPIINPIIAELENGRP